MKSLGSMSLRLFTWLMGKRIGPALRLLWYIFTDFISLICFKKKNSMKKSSSLDLWYAWRPGQSGQEKTIYGHRVLLQVLLTAEHSWQETRCWLRYVRRKECSMPVRTHGEFVGMKVSKNIISCKSGASQSWKSKQFRHSSPRRHFLSHHLSHQRSARTPDARADTEITLSVNADGLVLTYSIPLQALSGLNLEMFQATSSFCNKY